MSNIINLSNIPDEDRENIKDTFDIDSMEKEDLFNDDVWAYVVNAETELEKDKRLAQVIARSQELGFTKTDTRGFFESYLADVGAINQSQSLVRFKGMPGNLQLVMPEGWRWNDNHGIHTFDKNGVKVACSQPVIPIARYENVITGLEKIELWFSERGGRRVKTVKVDREVISNKNKILSLANHGLRVSSANANALVEYLQDIEAENSGIIPIHKSTSSLGWLKYGDNRLFLPYDEDIRFDSEMDYVELFDAVKNTKGTLEDWIEAVRPWRAKSHYVRLALAASFASVILRDINSLSFFVHFWSPHSSTGKTVLLYLAASVWGDPEPFTQSFNMTEVGMERTAGFLKNLPLVLDEMQLAKNQWGKANFSVYKLTQGRGRARGLRAGGVDYIPTWRLSILTSGETPLSTLDPSSGARARIFETLIKQPIFTLAEGGALVDDISQNYGHAGRKFIEHYKQLPKAKIREGYDGYMRALVENGVQAKQAMLGAALLTADNIACFALWGGSPEHSLSLDDVMTTLLQDGEDSVEMAAYEALTGFFAENHRNFVDDKFAECFGKINKEDNVTKTFHMTVKKVREVLDEAGISYESAQEVLIEAGLVIPRGDDKTPNVRLLDGTTQARCWEIVIDNDGVVT